MGFYRARLVWGRALAAATTLVSERLRPVREQGPDDRYGIALSVEVLAWIAAAARHPRRAATLPGAADSLWTEIGSSIGGYRYLEDDHRECERRTSAVIASVCAGPRRQCQRSIERLPGQQAPSLTTGSPSAFFGSVRHAFMPPTVTSATPRRTILAGTFVSAIAFLRYDAGAPPSIEARIRTA
jgi:hypothetical protein